MKNFALSSLFGLMIGFLAFAYASNVANAADNFTIHNANSSRTYYVAIAYSCQSRDTNISDSNRTCYTDVVRGWRTIEPGCSETFWKGRGACYILVEASTGGYVSNLPGDTLYYWVHDDRFLSTYKEAEPSSSVYFEDEPVLLDTYLWGDDSGSYRYYEEGEKYEWHYSHMITRYIPANHYYTSRDRGDGYSISIRDYNWLEDQLKSNGWRVRKFNRVSDSMENMTLH